ncbi:MAG: hypothetical protein ACI3ZY_14390 [Parabacteroides sp.]
MMMKNVICLCLGCVLATTSLFARDHRRGGGRHGEMNDSIRCERLITRLQLDEKQAQEFRKQQQEFAMQAKKEREQMQALREQHQQKMKALRDKQDAELKKLLTEEQYKQLAERRQMPKREQRGAGRR